MSFSALNAITPSASSFYLHQPPHHTNNTTHQNQHQQQQQSGSNINSSRTNNVNSTSNYPNVNGNMTGPSETKPYASQRSNVTLQANSSFSQGNPLTRRASQMSGLNSVVNYPGEGATRINARSTNRFNINTATSTLSFVKTQPPLLQQ